MKALKENADGEAKQPVSAEAEGSKAEQSSIAECEAKQPVSAVAEGSEAEQSSIACRLSTRCAEALEGTDICPTATMLEWQSESKSESLES